MISTKKCQETNCGNEIPLSLSSCPHCGRPSLFPNVDQANLPEEFEALFARYEAVHSRAAERNARQQLDSFERDVERSYAVNCCPFGVVEQISRSDNEIAATFYMRGVTNLSKGSNVLSDSGWDAIRPAAETAFFGDENKRHIHFAALSLTDEGVKHYGDCSVTFREELIAHRASVFEGNMLAFFKENGDNYWKTSRLPAGFRAVWRDRAVLAAAKLGDRIDATTATEEFPDLILKCRDQPDGDDEFVEVHIFGGITRRTIGKVVVHKFPNYFRKSLLRAMRARLKDVGVEWVERITTQS